MLQNIMAASKPMLINEEKSFIGSEIDLISLDLQEIIKLKNGSTKTFDNKTSISIKDKTNSEKSNDVIKKVKPRNSSPIRIRGRGRSNNKPKGTMIFRLNHIISFVSTLFNLVPTRHCHVMCYYGDKKYRLIHRNCP